MSTIEAALLVRSPAKGRVKRRLAADIGTTHAAALYRRFVPDMLAAFDEASVEPVICHHPPGDGGAVRQWLGQSRRLLGQRGRDHPMRLRHAIEDLFADGAERVMVFASDVPDLPARLISRARRALERADAVLGPSADGGYYVIGFQRERFVPGAFRGIEWGGERTFDQTAEIVRGAGRRLDILPQWHDVDTADDLVALFRRNRATAFRGSLTMGYLRHHPEVLGSRVGDAWDD